MLCVWVHDCDPGRVSDGSRPALYQTLFIECPSIFFPGMCFVLLFLSFCRLCFFVSCPRLSFVDVPLIFSCPADHVPDWQLRIILLGMVEARSVNVKNTKQQQQHNGKATF